MAARIDKIIDAPGKPGRKIIEGEPLPEDHAVYQAYVGRPTPPSARVRNPVTYFNSTVGGWPCGCGCGEEISPASSYAATSRPHCTSASLRSAPSPSSCAGSTPFGLVLNQRPGPLPPPG